MARTKVISFDLDGTLTDIQFVDSVWLEGIPHLYSLKNGISFEEAKKTVKREYDKVGRGRLEWYDLQHWIEKFGLNVSPRELLTPFEHRIRIFPEVPKVLDELKHRGSRLVIVTNARKEFVDAELGKVRIKNCFEHVFSSTSDFGLIKKTVNLYRRVCSILEIFPQEMIHIGDDRNFDFNVPRRLGILAFHLDRTGKHRGKFVIHSLEDLNEKLARLL
jgi:putative hydrolase of the HAD superfamily